MFFREITVLALFVGVLTAGAQEPGSFPADAPIREPAPLEITVTESPGAEIVATPVPRGRGVSLCDELDPDCRRRIMDFMTKINPLFPINAKVGARVSFGATPGAQAAVAVGDHLVSLKGWGGDIHVLPFEFVTIPGTENFRFKIKLADSEMAFVCTRKDNGKLEAPYLAFFMGEGCRPDAMVGVSAELMEYQGEATGRHAFRWAEAKAVLNFLRNGFAEDYLKKRIMAYAGVSADTVLATPGFEAQFPSSAGSAIRGSFGISGMYISDNSHWEIRGYAGYRPNFLEFQNDWAVEAGASVKYNWLLGNDFLLQIGGAAEYSHWKNPGRSIGTFASDRARDSLFVGTVFGFHYNPPPK